MKTTRIQRSRKKGSRLPEGAICCTRPGPWGNPFKAYDRASNVLLHRNWLLESSNIRLRIRIRRELKGKHLACWCKLSDPCHVANLIEVADSPTAGKEGK